MTNLQMPAETRTATTSSVAIEDAVENANTCTFHMLLKNCRYVVHFENIATEPPIMTYVTIARTTT